jgi:hypothetical protein
MPVLTELFLSSMSQYIYLDTLPFPQARDAIFTTWSKCSPDSISVNIDRDGEPDVTFMFSNETAKAFAHALYAIADARPNGG